MQYWNHNGNSEQRRTFTKLLCPLAFQYKYAMIKGGGDWYAFLFIFSFLFVFLFLYSFISSFFSIVTFLGWTRLHATWIKPEVVATKNIRDTYTTGSSRLDPGFHGVRVVHICVFFSSCVALPIVCPFMISCFRCSGPFFGE